MPEGRQRTPPLAAFGPGASPSCLRAMTGRPAPCSHANPRYAGGVTILACAPFRQEEPLEPDAVIDPEPELARRRALLS
jgi:hypothetical protein